MWSFMIVCPISVEHDSVAAEKVCRRQTHATVGSPVPIREYPQNRGMGRERSSRSKRCSWILVSCTLATFELVTIRQFTMPSETVSAIICRSRAWTTAGAAGEWSGCWGPPNMSARAAARMSFKDTVGLRTTSPLHRWIDRSKFAPAFYVGGGQVRYRLIRHRRGAILCMRPTLIEKSSTVLPPILVRCPLVVASPEPSSRAIRSRN